MMAPKTAKSREGLNRLLLAAVILLGFLFVIPSTGRAINKTSNIKKQSSSALNAPVLSKPRAHNASANADFQSEPKSRQVQQLADWIFKSQDNNGMPFIIIDKVGAKVFVFDGDCRFRGASAALIGSAKGDESVPGIGEREISEIRPEERTTPAGRFIAWLGYELDGKDLMWVEYDSSVSLHRVVTNKPEERRIQRLATLTPKDNRITYGCINVPSRFYDTIIRTGFEGTDGIVYILPEKKSTREVFPLYYDVD
jgi:hypothetical protein